VISQRIPPAQLRDPSSDELRNPAVQHDPSKPATPMGARGGGDPNERVIDQEDIDLMAAVQCGDEDAFERLVEKLWGRTLQYARALTGDRDRAQDVAQEAFARLWKKRSAWVPTGSVRVWLLRTAKNVVLSEQRKANVRWAWVLRVSREDVRSPPTPLQEAERSELRSAILDAVDKLSPRRKEAFVLFHLQGFSYRETAKIMMVREQTVANYLQAAVGDLRIALAPFFPALDRPDLDHGGPVDFDE
jgi:RNA polymerase sigma-70 factor, ECF subfamily